MPRKPTFNPAAAFDMGAAHRTSEMPQLAQKTKEAGRATPGRKADFPDEPVGRLNAFIPVELLFRIKKAAALSGKSLSAYIAEWAETL